MPGRMTENADPPPDKNGAQKAHAGPAPLRGFASVRRLWRRIYGPFDRASARILDTLAANDRRRKTSALVIAISINLIVLTALSVFGRVRIWVPNAPGAAISITLVEIPRLDLPELRDPEINPQPEPEPEPIPEPELIEEPEPEPEPEPEIVEEPEPEPEIVEEPEPEPEPEPELNLDLEPAFAPPAEDPEPLILDAADAAQDDLTLPAPQEDVVDQAPVEDEPEPLLAAEPERRQEAGLDEFLGDDDDDGEDNAGDDGADDEGADEGADNEPEEERLVEDEPDEQPQNDDIFDQAPSLSGRRFVRPLVQLPLGEAPIDTGSSGVVAIFCPEEFDDKDKAAECAGRRELFSGWRPGDSGEDYSRAVKLLRDARKGGRTGPELDKLIGRKSARRLEDQRRIEQLRDFRRDVPGGAAIVEGLDDNILGGVKSNRPDIGPSTQQPGWTLREDPDLTLKDIEELEKALKEAEKNK